MSYSQNREEAAILEAVKGFEVGGVLDIGANDGATLSNSRALMERGWYGLFVEPDYEAFGKLAALYAGNPKAVLLNAAVDTEAGIGRFSKTKDGGLASFMGTSPWEEYVTQRYFVARVLPAQVADLAPRGIDVITVDIEGRSFEVMAGLPLSSWDVKVLCVEHDGRALEIAAWGRERRYAVAELNAENIVLVRHA